MDDNARNQLINAAWMLWSSQMVDPPPMVLVQGLVDIVANPFAHVGIWAVPSGTLASFEGRPAPYVMHNVVLYDGKACALNGYTERAMRKFAKEVGAPGSEVNRWGQRPAELV